MTFSLLRSYFILNPLIVLATAVYGSVNLIAAFWDTEGGLQLRIARSWARMLLRIAGVRVTVEGLDKLDPAQSYVITPNHVSYFDTPVVLAHIPANFRFMAKQELFKIPFIGNHLEKAGHISVPLDDPRAALKVLSAAGKAMKERGLSLLVFPEGGRSETGRLQEFKDGAAYLAIKGAVTVLPVCLIGMDAILPMHSGHVRPGPVTLRIGDPIPTDRLSPSDRAALTAQIRATIIQLGAQ